MIRKAATNLLLVALLASCGRTPRAVQYVASDEPRTPVPCVDDPSCEAAHVSDAIATIRGAATVYLGLVGCNLATTAPSEGLRVLRTRRLLPPAVGQPGDPLPVVGSGTDAIVVTGIGLGRIAGEVAVSIVLAAPNDKDAQIAFSGIADDPYLVKSGAPEPGGSGAACASAATDAQAAGTRLCFYLDERNCASGSFSKIIAAAQTIRDAAANYASAVGCAMSTAISPAEGLSTLRRRQLIPPAARQDDPWVVATSGAGDFEVTGIGLGQIAGHDAVSILVKTPSDANAQDLVSAVMTDSFFGRGGAPEPGGSGASCAATPSDAKAAGTTLCFFLSEPGCLADATKLMRDATRTIRDAGASYAAMIGCGGLPVTAPPQGLITLRDGNLLPLVVGSSTSWVVAGSGADAFTVTGIGLGKIKNQDAISIVFTSPSDASAQDVVSSVIGDGMFAAGSLEPGGTGAMCANEVTSAKASGTTICFLVLQPACSAALESRMTDAVQSTRNAVATYAGMVGCGLSPVTPANGLATLRARQLIPPAAGAADPWVVGSPPEAFVVTGIGIGQVPGGDAFSISFTSPSDMAAKDLVASVLTDPYFVRSGAMEPSGSGGACAASAAEVWAGAATICFLVEEPDCLAGQETKMEAVVQTIRDAATDYLGMVGCEFVPATDFGLQALAARRLIPPIGSSGWVVAGSWMKGFTVKGVGLGQYYWPGSSGGRAAISIVFSTPSDATAQDVVVSALVDPYFLKGVPEPGGSGSVCATGPNDATATKTTICLLLDEQHCIAQREAQMRDAIDSIRKAASDYAGLVGGSLAPPLAPAAGLSTLRTQNLLPPAPSGNNSAPWIIAGTGSEAYVVTGVGLGQVGGLNALSIVFSSPKVEYAQDVTASAIGDAWLVHGGGPEPGGSGRWCAASLVDAQAAATTLCFYVQ